MGTILLRHVEALGMAGSLSSLSPNARLVLYVMAMNAHDNGTKDAPPRTYFRGWEHLARAALGRTTYDEAARFAVQRAIRELTDAGRLKVVGRRHGHRQQPAMYELHL